VVRLYRRSCVAADVGDSEGGGGGGGRGWALGSLLWLQARVAQAQLLLDAGHLRRLDTLCVTAAAEVRAATADRPSCSLAQTARVCCCDSRKPRVCAVATRERLRNRPGAALKTPTRGGSAFWIQLAPDATTAEYIGVRRATRIEFIRGSNESIYSPFRFSP
jgi:hypothetical protein